MYKTKIQLVQVLNMESYFDPRHPASFSGSQNFYRHLDKNLQRNKLRIGHQSKIRILYTNLFDGDFNDVKFMPNV